MRALTALLVIFALQAQADVGTARAALERYQQARAAMNQAMAQQNQEALQAEQATAGEALQVARAAFEEAGVVEAGTPEDVLAYAVVLEENGDYDLAAEALQTLIPRAETAEVWRRIDVNLLHVGEDSREEAYAALKKSLAMDAASAAAAETRYLLGDVYVRQGLYSLAEPQFAEALKLNANHLLAKLDSAALSVRRGEITQASDTLDALGAEAQPHDVHTRLLLREMLQIFERTQQPFEDTQPNHSAYARLLYRAARTPEAILAAQRAVKLNPQHIETLNLLGAMQLQLGAYQAAVESYGASLVVNADQPSIQQTVANVKQALAEQQQQQQSTAPQAPTPAPAPTPTPPAAPAQDAPEETTQAPAAPAQPEPLPEAPAADAVAPPQELALPQEAPPPQEQAQPAPTPTQP